MKGLIFSIEEFAVHDGEGLRAAIFFKGCPLRCQWCHNPEGLSIRPQRAKNPNACLHCRRCEAVCPSPGRCTACGRCVPYCPRDLIRIVGETWEATQLARHVKGFYPPHTRGGVTLSGGEVLMQPEFLLELLDALSPLHRAIETSGYCPTDLFGEVLRHLEFVFMDIKHMDEQQHRTYTGVSNQKILENLEILKASGVPFVIRVPVIAGVNDDNANMAALARRLTGCKSLRFVELLPYNRMAGAKYRMVDMEYAFSFEAPSIARLEEIVRLFDAQSVHCKYRNPVG